MNENEIKLRRKLNECISAIRCCGSEFDERGEVFKPEIGIMFLKSIEKTLDETNPNIKVKKDLL